MLCDLILCQIYLPMNEDFILIILMLTAHLIIGNVGHRTILPSSFVGSPRDMIQRFQDAMNLVQKFGKPDLFITMTCNPGWEEIRNELLPRQISQDRPDLLARIFKAKFEELKEDIINKRVLGRVVAHVHVFEFQKRGLPHVHMLLILDDNDNYIARMIMIALYELKYLLRTMSLNCIV